MAEGGLDNMGQVPQGGASNPDELNRGEQVRGAFETEDPAQATEALEAAIAPEMRNASPVTITSEIMSALTAPDATHIESEIAARFTANLNDLPDWLSQAFIVGGTLDGENVRVISQTCIIAHDRLRLCGEPVFRVGTAENGESSTAVYAVYTLDQLFKNGVIVLGANYGTDHQIAGFAEAGLTFDIPGSESSVEAALGSFNSEEYIRLSYRRAAEIFNLDLQVAVQVVVKEGVDGQDPEVQPTITLSRQFGNQD